MADKEEKKAQVDRAQDEYRKSGIALMATVIALSSGGLAGLSQIGDAKHLSFLYLIPISLAVLQQLAHYLGSKAVADSIFNHFRLDQYADEREHMEASIGGTIYYMHSKLHYEMADLLSALACASLWLVTLLPLIALSPALVSVSVIITTMLAITIWIWKWRKTEAEISKFEW